jgi:hypothetical protein
VGWRVKSILGAILLATAPFWLVPDAPFWRQCVTGVALVFGCALILDGTLSRR